jgi:hypothetical protein
MPWIVAEEISKVLRPGGAVAVETHFSFSEHELPWHFFQFNPNALRVLFNNELGFDTVHASLLTPMVGRFSASAGEHLAGKAISSLYCHSSIIARKVSSCLPRSLARTVWHDELETIVASSMYPDKTGLSA